MEHETWEGILIRNLGRDPQNAVQDRRDLVDLVNRLSDTIDCLVDQEKP